MENEQGQIIDTKVKRWSTLLLVLLVVLVAFNVVVWFVVPHTQSQVASDMQEKAAVSSENQAPEDQKINQANFMTQPVNAPPPQTSATKGSAPVPTLTTQDKKNILQGTYHK